MKRLLVATSVLALGLGGGIAFAQTGTDAPGGSMSGPSGSSAPSYSAAPSRTTNGPAMNQSNINPSPANSGSMARASRHISASQVKQAQEALQNKGLYSGRIDGIYGPKTRHAIAKFQEQNGLQQTAELDEQTMMKLESGAGNGASESSGMGSSPPSSGMGSSPPSSSHY